MFSDSTKLFSFERFDGGINKYSLKTDVLDNQLSSGVNVYFDGKSLRTRNGVKYDFTQQLPDNFTDFSIKQIGSTSSVDTDTVKFFLISQKTTFQIISYLFVLKSDGEHSLIYLNAFSDDINTPMLKEVRATVVCGGQGERSGIYVLMGAVGNDKVYDRAIFELNQTLTSVYAISDSEIYAPTVLLNGRGSAFCFSDSLVPSEFPTPRKFESFNTVGGRFKAYFKTDGISSYFVLPAKTLSNAEGEDIYITYKDAKKGEYTWHIPWDKNVSEEVVKYNDYDIKMYVDRSRARIYTMDTTAAPAVLPIAYSVPNNLEIIAYKQIDYTDVFGMTISENFNARSYLSGNDLKGNQVRFSAKANPLYFPETSLSYFGENTSCATGMCRQNDRIVIFKPHSIALCSAIDEKHYDLDMVVTGRAHVGSTLETMQIKTVSSTVGSIYPETFVSCANRVVFLGTDKNVYTITSTSNYTQRLYNISRNISPMIYSCAGASQVFACDMNSHYMLFFKEKCFLFNYNTKAFLSASQTATSSRHADGVCWYYFEYNFGGAVPCAVLCSPSGAYFITKRSDTQLAIYKTDGSYDIVLEETGQTKIHKIFASLSTKASDFDSPNVKNVLVLSLTFENLLPNTHTNLTIDYFDENTSNITDNLKLSALGVKQVTIPKVPCVFGVKNFGFTVSGDAPFALKCADVRYR